MRRRLNLPRCGCLAQMTLAQPRSDGGVDKCHSVRFGSAEFTERLYYLLRVAAGGGHTPDERRSWIQLSQLLGAVAKQGGPTIEDDVAD
jgi:hypothetical protein